MTGSTAPSRVVAPSSGVEGSDLVVTISTPDAAALFQPVRSRVKDAVDRPSKRAGYEAGQAVEAFTHQVRDVVDMDTIRERMTDTVATAVQPTRVSVWLAEVVAGSA